MSIGVELPHPVRWARATMDIQNVKYNDKRIECDDDDAADHASIARDATDASRDPKEPSWQSHLESCLRRIRRWRVPPNWSYRDWQEEARAVAFAAVWQGVREFDPSRRVPLEAFLKQRVLAGVYTRYRQEWAYARRFRESGSRVEVPIGVVHAIAPSSSAEHLREAMLCLSTEDRTLLVQLFWEGRTQLDVARRYKISQQAVSKRLKAVLRHLGEILELVNVVSRPSQG